MTDAVDAQQSDIATAPTETGRRQALRFWWHFAQMVIAMFVGMMVLGPIWRLVYTPLGAVGFFTRVDVAALVMATNMTIGMTAWMVFRRHRSAPIAEMAAAMYVPFLVLLVPYWLGVLSGDLVMSLGHLLMLPAMLLAMVLRRDEYSRHRH
jgi:hypothetical protein